MIKSYKLLAFILLAIFTFLAVSSVWPGRKSGTCDEIAHHIPAGYVFLDQFDHKMATATPPLSRYIVAFPLKLFMDLKLPSDSKKWRVEDRSEFGRDFFYKYNDDPEKILFLSRISVVLVGILCGFFVFIWAKRSFGNEAALLSLFMYVFSPNILAHARLATSDMTMSCFMLIALYMFWIFLNKHSYKYVVLSGISLGLTQLSKYSAIILYPFFMSILLFGLFGGKGNKDFRKTFMLKGFLIIIISLVVIWGGYGFRVEPVLENAMRVHEKLDIIDLFAAKMFSSNSENISRWGRHILTEIPLPLGAHILGLFGVLSHGHQGHSTFFFGNLYTHGTPLYFVGAYLIKTPIPLILMFFSGIMISMRDRQKRRETLYIITAIFIFFTAASFSKLQLGLRYILPIYPLSFIIAGRVSALFTRTFNMLLIWFLLVWYAATSLSAWPDYLSYFNEFTGGTDNGYKYLRDSNIDWGQDLPGLGKYLRENGIDKVKMLYFGMAKPEQYKIRYETCEDKDLKTPGREVYAISVNYIDSVKWAKDEEPDAKIGGSIFVYDMRGQNKY